MQRGDAVVAAEFHKLQVAGSIPAPATFSLKYNIAMERYISTGIVTQYCFTKTQNERQYERLFGKKIPFSELKEEIINQFPQIYDHKEDELSSHGFFTDLLRYRMRPDKFADAFFFSYRLSRLFDRQ